MTVPPRELVVWWERQAPGLWRWWRSALIWGVGPNAASLRISSWYRAPAENRAVGGVERSQHLLGLALDLVGPRFDLENVLVRMQALGWAGMLESVGTSNEHLHLQPFRPADLAPLWDAASWPVSVGRDV